MAAARSPEAAARRGHDVGTDPARMRARLAPTVGWVDALGPFLPRRCAGCAAVGSALCAACVGRLVRVGPTGCARCGAPGPWPVARCAACPAARPGFATARAALVYDAALRPIVAAWKEQGRRDLTDVLAALVETALARPAADALTFVPGERERRLERGHVPAESLARALGRRWGIEVVALLERVDGASPRRQAGLGRAERQANVRGAFRATRTPAPAVCLVDDVYTTGATASACATALRRGGAQRVHVVALARAIR
jgi:ComF family protein